MERTATEPDRENRPRQEQRDTVGCKSIPDFAGTSGEIPVNRYNRPYDPKRESDRSDAERDPVAALHRSVGNQAVKDLHEQGVLRAKLAVSRPTDRSEREAERVADRVVCRSPSEPAVDTEITDEIGPTASAEREGETIEGPASDRVEGLDGGRQLSQSVRSYFEPRFGRDFSDVRVHTGPEADEAARSIGAKAFTVGSDIAFATGAYRPGTTAGKRLLAHELTHVVQASDRAPTVRRQESRTANQSGSTSDADSVPIVRGGETKRVDPETARKTEKKWSQLIQEEMEHVRSTVSNHQRYLEQKSRSFGSALAHTAAEMFGGNFSGAPEPSIWDPARDHLLDALRAIKTEEPMNLDAAREHYEKGKEAYEEAKQEFYEFETSTMESGSSRVVSTLAFTRDASFTIVGALASGGGMTTGQALAWGAGSASAGKLAQETTEYAVGLDKRFQWDEVAKETIWNFVSGYLGGKLNDMIVGKLVNMRTGELAEEFGEDAAKQLLGSEQLIYDVVADFVETSGTGVVKELVDEMYDSFTGTGTTNTGRELLADIADKVIGTDAFRNVVLSRVGAGGEAAGAAMSE